MSKKTANMHIHSKFSYDSRMDFPLIAHTLEEGNIQWAGIADHIELSYDQLKEILHFLYIRNYEIDDINQKTNVHFLKGLEVSEPHLHQDDMYQIIEHNNIDYIIGSIHHVLGVPIKKMQYHPQLEELYLKSLLTMVETADIDAVAHLDYLKRYIGNPIFNQTMLEEILKIIIERGLALEVNTSGLRRCSELFPAPDIIELYAELGGKRVIIGSDAHRQNELLDSLDEANSQLEPYHFEIGIIKKRSFRQL